MRFNPAVGGAHRVVQSSRIIVNTFGRMKIRRRRRESWTYIALKGWLRSIRRLTSIPTANGTRLPMIRFGLLGCGRIAKRHSELLGGNHIQGASLVAVCDPLRARADAIAGKFGVPAHYDMDDFLARKDNDAVAMWTRSGRHAKHIN